MLFEERIHLIIGARLQALRESAGLDREDVARSAGLMTQTYASVEAGDLALDAERLPMILERVGGTLADLFTDDQRISGQHPSASTVAVLTRPDNWWVEQTVRKVFADAGLGAESPLAGRVAAQVIAQAQAVARATPSPEDLLAVTTLGLGLRAHNCLERAGLRTVGDVHRTRLIPYRATGRSSLVMFESSQSLLEMRGFGTGTLLELVDALARVGWPHPQDADARQFCDRDSPRASTAGMRVILDTVDEPDGSLGQ